MTRGPSDTRNRVADQERHLDAMRGRSNPTAPDSGERLLRIVRRLLAGETITSRDVIREFGVSRETASRDVALLGMYLPLEIERSTFGAQGGRFKVIRLPR